MVSILFPNKRNQDFLKKWLIPGLGQGKYKMSLELPMVIENKKLLKKTKPPPTMFTAAQFTINKTWKQPKCPPTEEWIKKMWYIYNGILFSHKKE